MGQSTPISPAIWAEVARRLDDDVAAAQVLIVSNNPIALPSAGGTPTRVDPDELLHAELGPSQLTLFEPAREPTLVERLEPPALIALEVDGLPLDAEERDTLRDQIPWLRGRFTGEVVAILKCAQMVGTGGLLVVAARSDMFRRHFGHALLDALEPLIDVEDVLDIEGTGKCVFIARRLDQKARGSVALLRTLGRWDAAQVLDLLSAGSRTPLGQVLDGIPGRTTTCGFEELWQTERTDVPTRTLLHGEDVRDWQLGQGTRIIWPYDELGRPLEHLPAEVETELRQHRRALEQRRIFGKTLEEHGRPWYEHLEHYPARLQATTGIVFSANATDPHFVPLDGHFAFSRSAPILRLHDSAPDQVHFLAGLLNSSTASFWMKTTFVVTGIELSFETTASELVDFPLPSHNQTRIGLCAKKLLHLASSLADPSAAFDFDGDEATIESKLEDVLRHNHEIRQRMVWWQEELDWEVYYAFGIADCRRDDLSPTVLSPGDRAFESEASLVEDPLVASRATAAAADPALGCIESSIYKRRWSSFDVDESMTAARTWLLRAVLDGFESDQLIGERPQGIDVIEAWITARAGGRVALAKSDKSLTDVLYEQSAPFLASERLTAGALTRDRNEPLSHDDYAARATSFPRRSAASNRRQWWRNAARFDDERLRPLHYFVRVSNVLELPAFAPTGPRWHAALSDHAEPSPRHPQIDLARIVELKTWLSEGEVDVPAVIREFTRRGWTIGEIRTALGIVAPDSNA